MGNINSANIKTLQSLRFLIPFRMISEQFEQNWVNDCFSNIVRFDHRLNVFFYFFFALEGDSPKAVGHGDAAVP